MGEDKTRTCTENEIARYETYFIGMTLCSVYTQFSISRDYVRPRPVEHPVRSRRRAQHDSQSNRRVRRRPTEHHVQQRGDGRRQHAVSVPVGPFENHGRRSDIAGHENRYRRTTRTRFVRVDRWLDFRVVAQLRKELHHQKRIRRTRFRYR